MSEVPLYRGNQEALQTICKRGARLDIRDKVRASTFATRCEREFYIDNLLVRVHFVIVMIRWTGLAPWEFEPPFPGSLTSTFLDKV